MNSHIAGVVKAQALVRGVLLRLRLKRDPKYKRLFRPQPEAERQTRYDRVTMWDLEQGDLVEYSERRHKRRKPPAEPTKAAESAISDPPPVTELVPLSKEIVAQPSSDQPVDQIKSSIAPAAEDATAPLNAQSAPPEPESTDPLEEGNRQRIEADVVYSREQASPEPNSSPKISLSVWKLDRTQSAISPEPEVANFPSLEVPVQEASPQAILEHSQPEEGKHTLALQESSASKASLEAQQDPPILEEEKKSSPKEPQTSSHFHRRANSYRSHHENSTTALPEPVKITEKAESPLAAETSQVLPFPCEPWRPSSILETDEGPVKTEFPVEKPETPVPVEVTPSQHFAEAQMLLNAEGLEETELPVQTKFPIRKPETPELSAQQLTFPMQMHLSSIATEELAPEPAYFPPVKPETPVSPLAAPSQFFQGVSPPQPHEAIVDSVPVPTFFPVLKPETPVAGQTAPSAAFQSTTPPLRLHPADIEEPAPIQTVFHAPLPPVMRPDTPVIKTETPVSSQPAPSHIFPSIGPVSRAATPSGPEIPPVLPSTRPKSPLTSLFFQPHLAPLQSSAFHSTYIDTPSDRTPSFPPSLNASSRKGGAETPKNKVPVDATLMGNLSSSFRSFGKRGSAEKRPEPPPLIMQGVDFRTQNEVSHGRMRSKSHTRDWSMSQPETYKSSLPTKSLLRETIPEPRSLSRGRRHPSNPKTPEQRLLRLISPYDPSWNKRVLEKVFRIGVEVRLRPNAYLPDLIIRRLRRNGVKDLQPARARELEEMELL